MRLFIVGALGTVLLVACGERSPLDGAPTTPDASDAAPLVDASDASKVDPPWCDCVDAPPWGWQYVGYDAQGRADCPSGYESPTDLVEASLDATNASCTCSCDPQVQGTPSYVPTGVQIGVGNSCSGYNYFSATSGCNTASFSYSPGSPFDLETYVHASRGGVACSPVKTTNVLPTLATSETRACTIAKPYGQCADYRVCLPKSASADFMRCLASSGPASACPPGFPVRHDAGTSAKNTSWCSASNCWCTMTADWHEKMNVYSDTTCTTLSATLDAAGTCNLDSASSLAFESFELSYAFTGSCGLPYAMPAATASFVYQGQQTFCCDH